MLYNVTTLCAVFFSNAMQNNFELRKWDNQELIDEQLNSDDNNKDEIIIFSSENVTNSDNNNTNKTTNNTSHKTKWNVLIGIFLLKLIVPGVLASQGVLISHLLFQPSKNNISTVFLPSVVYVSTWIFLEPWFRRAGYNHRGGDTKLIAGCGILLLAMALATTSLGIGVTARTIIFGLLGGTGASMAISQCSSQSALHSRNNQMLILTLCNIAQALSQFIAPLVMVLLLSGYGVSGASLLQAALVLHGLAAALLLRVAPTTSNIIEMDEYKQVPIQEDLIDLSDEGNSDEGEPETDNKLRNHLGVEIMPTIIEEDEEDDDEEEEEIVTSKRFTQSYRDSWCPLAPLEIYQTVQEDSTVQGNSPKPLLTPSSIRLTNFKFKKSVKWNRCCARFTLFFTSTFSSIYKNIKYLCKPFIISAILMSSTINLIPLFIAILIPSIAQHGMYTPRHDAAFTLSTFGFTWLSTAICTPCIIKSASQKLLTIVYSIITLLSATGLYVLAQAKTAHILTVGTALVGLSHGILVFITPLILRDNLYKKPDDFIGLSPISTCVERLTAILILIGAILASCWVETVWNYSEIFAVIGTIQACISVGWIAWEFMKFINTYLSTYNI